jgi:hypothetical protein
MIGSTKVFGMNLEGFLVPNMMQQKPKTCKEAMKTAEEGSIKCSDHRSEECSRSKCHWNWYIV